MYLYTFNAIVTPAQAVRIFRTAVVNVHLLVALKLFHLLQEVFITGDVMLMWHCNLVSLLHSFNCFSTKQKQKRIALY